MKTSFFSRINPFKRQQYTGSIPDNVTKHVTAAVTPRIVTFENLESNKSYKIYFSNPFLKYHNSSELILQITNDVIKDHSGIKYRTAIYNTSANVALASKDGSVRLLHNNSIYNYPMGVFVQPDFNDYSPINDYLDSSKFENLNGLNVDAIEEVPSEGGGQNAVRIAANLRKREEPQKRHKQQIYIQYMYIWQIQNGKKQQTKTDPEELQTSRQCMYADIQSPSFHTRHVRLFQEPDIPNGPSRVDHCRRRHRQDPRSR